MVKYILLIRHVESMKNKRGQLASKESQEELTERGIKQAKIMADHIVFFLEKKELSINQIYCADSKRAYETGIIIASKIYPEVKVIRCSEFKSFNIGVYAGLSERKINKINPEFINNLSLYRKGVVNSYDIVYGGTKQITINYEKAIKKRLKIIMDQENTKNKSTCVIIVMHRSALTATLLDIARDYYGYPKDFYGYIKINLGSLNLVSINENGNKKFELLCENSKKLLTYKKD